MVEAAVGGDLIRARLQGKQSNAEEGTEVHEEIHQQIENHAGVTGFCTHNQTNHHKARLGNRRIGQHPLKVGLSDRDHIAQHHRQNRKYRKNGLPLACECWEYGCQKAQR